MILSPIASSARPLSFTGDPRYVWTLFDEPCIHLTEEMTVPNLNLQTSRLLHALLPFYSVLIHISSMANRISNKT